MIAASLKNAEGDAIIDLLLRKDADVNIKSVSGQVSNYPNSLNKPFSNVCFPTERSSLRSLQSQPLNRQNPHRP